MSSTQPKITIWIWPTGLFPRRIVYFFLAKKISLSTLSAHNIHLIPVHLDSTGLISAQGFESRPTSTSTSLPLMRLEYPNQQDFLIHETSAILEYLQEIFSNKDGDVDLTGSTMQQRARSRDIMSLLAEAIVWSGVDIFHSDPATTAFSGLSREDQSEAAARHANGKFQKLLEKLEGWVRDDIMSKETMSLAGEGGNVTFADLALMAPVEYMRGMYGREWIEGHEVLQTWHARMNGQDWVVGREKLRNVEKTGDWAAILGE